MAPDAIILPESFCFTTIISITHIYIYPDEAVCYFVNIYPSALHMQGGFILDMGVHYIAGLRMVPYIFIN